MVILNNDQKKSVHDIIAFLDDPDPNNNFFLLEGQAGTGKTTCINHVIMQRDESFILTAPTNKATRVLRLMAEQEGVDVHTRTIYSLLGLGVTYAEDLLAIAESGKHSVHDYDVIVVDEASMVNEEVMSKIKRHKNRKFIFMGDPYQLPPIGEEKALPMTLLNKATLNKVERHDNQILKLATAIRKSIDEGGSHIKVVTDKDENGGVVVVPRTKFKDIMGNMLTSNGYKEDPNLYKVVAWRNNTVIDYNEHIREKLYGEESWHKKFVTGERVVACHPIIYDKVPLMMTDEESNVKKMIVRPHPVYNELKCYELTLVTDDDKEVMAHVIHQDSERRYKQLLEEYAESARARKMQWKEFWDLKQNFFADIRPCHSITSHRSQGSTYKVVMVDAGDILCNQNLIESLKCLYVAVTRASKMVVLTL